MWRKVREGVYEHLPSGTLVTAERPDGGAHIAIWEIVGMPGKHQPTLRDAKAYVEARWTDGTLRPVSR